MAWKRPGVRIPLAPLLNCRVLLGLDAHSGGTLTTDAVLLFVSLSWAVKPHKQQSVIQSFCWVLPSLIVARTLWRWRSGFLNPIQFLFAASVLKRLWSVLLVYINHHPVVEAYSSPNPRGHNHVRRRQEVSEKLEKTTNVRNVWKILVFAHIGDRS